MKFIVIFGPPAVGKMTVGQALEKITGFKLFHNHQSIDLVTQYFPYGTPSFDRLVPSFRKQIIEEAAISNLPGLIFTFVWDFDDPADKHYIDELRGLVEKHGGESYYVELEAEFEERIYRNKTENRIKHKPSSKADTVQSEKNLREHEAKYRMNSNDDFFYTLNYLKLNNTHINPEEVAEQIVAHFNFPRLDVPSNSTEA